MVPIDMNAKLISIVRASQSILDKGIRLAKEAGFIAGETEP